MVARDRDQITEQLRSLLELYQKLGFEYLPLNASNVEVLIKQGMVCNDARRGVSAGPEEPHTSAAGQASLQELREEIGDCRLCRLSKGRKHIVFGEGSPHARLMFVGEGPGREEDIQGRPFVGDAGKVLTNLIRKMGFERGDVYIANIVKCRPPMNRNPEDDEIAACLPFLKKQIDLVRPRVIMSLGKFASQAIVGLKTPISRLRGHFYSYEGIPVMPTFHPAYLMRNPKDKWLTWEDAQRVLEKLKEVAVSG